MICGGAGESDMVPTFLESQRSSRARQDDKMILRVKVLLMSK